MLMFNISTVPILLLINFPDMDKITSSLLIYGCRSELLYSLTIKGQTAMNIPNRIFVLRYVWVVNSELGQSAGILFCKKRCCEMNSLGRKCTEDMAWIRGIRQRNEKNSHVKDPKIYSHIFHAALYKWNMFPASDAIILQLF